MGSALYELFALPVELIARGGKPAGAVAIVLGLLLVPCGLWLTFGFLGPDHYWPIMLSVSGFGLLLAAAGLASFFGTQARLAAFDLDGDDQQAGSPDVVVLSDSPVMQAAIPFWVCSGCAIVRDGSNLTQRCDQCGSTIDFMAVDTEEDRKLAAAMLSG